MADYKVMKLELKGGVHKALVCDGPVEHSPWTAIYNCLQLKLLSLQAGDVIIDHLTEQHLKEYILSELRRSFAQALSSPDEDSINQTNLVKQPLLDLVASDSVHLEIAPSIESTTSFGESLAYWLFPYLSIDLVHGWVLNPEDAKAVGINDLEVLLREENLSTNECALINSLLNAKELTSYGFTSLKQDVREDGFCVFYRNRTFSVIHKSGESLLILETNREFLERYPQARWRVFEEGDGDSIYLTGRYVPAKDQPNIERAKKWYREKLAAMRTAETSYSKEPAQKDGDTGEASISEEPAQKDGDIGQSSRKPSRSKLRRAAARARKEATEADHPPAPASSEEEKLKRQADEIVDKGADTQEATTCSHDNPDQPAMPESSSCTTAEGEKTGRTNEREGGEAQEAAAPTFHESHHPNVTGSSSCTTAEEEKTEQADDREEGEVQEAEVPSSNQTEHSNVPESSSCPAEGEKTGRANETEEDKKSSTAGDEFLKFLLQFQDGSSRLNEDGSPVPYFKGIAEGMKVTGSLKLYVSYLFVKKYNKELAILIRDQYSRIEEDLSNAVCQYLIHHGIDTVKAFAYAELKFFDLPATGSFQSFKSFVHENDMLESYYNSSDGVEKSPSSVGRKMALGYLHKLLKKFKEGRCFGGNWSEDNLEVTDSGSDFVIDCKDEELTPEGALADLLKYCATVLVHLKDENGRMPPYYKAFEDDCMKIPNHREDCVRWALYLEYMGSPLLLKAPLVRSAFLCNLYRVAAARRTGDPAVYVPLFTKDILDWRSNATQHWLLKKVYDYNNYVNGPRHCSYMLNHWNATHWSLVQFCRHFTEHALLYTKKDGLVQQIVDISVLDLVLSRQLETWIAQAVRFLVFNCGINGIFSSAWRHYVASECADKPREISKSEEELVSIVSEVLVGCSLPEKSDAIAWAYTEIEIVEKHTHQCSFKSVVMANMSLIDFVERLTNLGLQAKLIEDGDGDAVVCGSEESFSVYKITSSPNKDGPGDLHVAVEGPLGKEYYEIIDQISLFMNL